MVNNIFQATKNKIKFIIVFDMFSLILYLVNEEITIHLTKHKFKFLPLRSVFSRDEKTLLRCKEFLVMSEI